jgi:hypothetical protein
MATTVTTVPNTFASLSGPIALSLLDQNYSALLTALNSMNSYSNYLQDTSAVVNAIAVTTPTGIAATLSAGLRLQIQVANSTTSQNVTLTVNGGSSANVITAAGVTESFGVLLAGQIIDVLFDGTYWRLLGQGNFNGTFTGTFTGLVTPYVATCYYAINGPQATIWVGNSITSVSNSTSMTMTGLPSYLQPPTLQQFIPCSLYDNSIPVMGAAIVNAASATVTFARSNLVAASTGSASQFVSSGFTASGNKGPYSTTFSYLVL